MKGLSDVWRGSQEMIYPKENAIQAFKGLRMNLRCTTAMGSNFDKGAASSRQGGETLFRIVIRL